MIKHSLKLLVLLSVLVLLMGARTAELEDPVTLDVPAGLKAEQVNKALKKALLGRKWSIAKDGKTSIESVLYIRRHVVTIRVDYNAEKVSFNYVSSENMNFSDEDGTRRIHKNYNAWVQNLANDARIEMQRVLYAE